MTDLVALIRSLAAAMAARSSAVECTSLLGTLDGPLQPNFGAPVRLTTALTALLRGAVVMPEPDGTAAWFSLELSDAVPISLNALADLGPTTEPYYVNSIVPRRVRFKARVDGCTVAADLDDDDHILAVFVRWE